MIHNNYVPELEKYIRGSSDFIQRNRENIHLMIRNLKSLIETVFRHKASHHTSNISECLHESLLVLLMALAIEKGAISDSHGRQPERQDWDKLK